MDEDDDDVEEPDESKGDGWFTPGELADDDVNEEASEQLFEVFTK